MRKTKKKSQYAAMVNCFADWQIFCFRNKIKETDIDCEPAQKFFKSHKKKGFKTTLTNAIKLGTDKEYQLKFLHSDPNLLSKSEV